jgi:hypothetical protein
VERKMLVESIRRLSEFGGLDTYRYVGFGSTYFSDFSLFHKTLGLDRMISIEKDVQNRRRFRFNRPFVCIKLLFGDSNTVLPTLSWRSKVILWLDYDSRLDASVLTDINHFCTYAAPGSMLILTVDARPGTPPEDRLKDLQRRVGELKVPPDVTPPRLAQWGTAAAYRRIINNEILEQLNNRNGSIDVPRQILYRQLFNFRYADGTQMVTVGGIIYERRQQNVFGRCAFGKNLPFIREGEDAYLIEAPNLTFRELHYLDSKLPTRSALKAQSIPSEDLARYARLYRYFPRFAETEF